MVEIHSEVDTTTIKVDNQMLVFQVQVGKNTIEDVLLNGRASVNIITKNLITKLGLPKPRLAPHHLTLLEFLFFQIDQVDQMGLFY
jgi:hypothetical protein